MKKRKVIIMGAAGRDFHNFNTFFRDNEDYEVVAFTATQIPDIDGRKYPAELAGELYPEGIDIHPEEKLPELIRETKVDEVIFAYSDVPYKYVMNRSALVNALGPDFTVMGYEATKVKSTKPVISICAVRTGCGKSQTTRFVYDIFKKMDKKVVAIRHPMPYGDLVKQAVQRFAEIDDLDKHNCTIEEMEEYEPHIAAGNIIYSGVDYKAIVRKAEETDNPDVILWDGGNNDLPFYESDLKIVVVDPHRPGHEEEYFPGEANLRMADIVVINKMDSASAEGIEAVKNNVRRIAPDALIVEADSELTVKGGDISGKKVLVVEDGPTLTHGEMKYGAAAIAAKRNGAEMVEPRDKAVGKIAETYEKYPYIGKGILPAMGYGEEQKKDLEKTINSIEADVVLSGTPIDLKRVVNANKPIVNVGYELKPRSGFESVIEKAIKEKLFG